MFTAELIGHHMKTPCIECRIEGKIDLNHDLWHVINMDGRIAIPIQRITTQPDDPQRVNLYGDFAGCDNLRVLYKGQEAEVT